MERCLTRGAVALLAVLAVTVPAAGAQDSRVLSLADVVRDADADFVPDRLGEHFVVEGVAITSPQRARGEIQYVVIQDDSGGIRILTEDAVLLRGIAPGTRVRAAGVLTHRRGSEELLVDTVWIIGDEVPPAPREVLVADLLSERYMHQLVRVAGHLTIANIVPGEELGAEITDRSGTIAVRVPTRLRDHPELARAWVFAGQAEIVGIVGQADTEAPFDADYRLAPRGVADFYFVPAPPYGAIGFGGLSVALLAAVLVLSVMRRRSERRADALASLAADLETSREAMAADLDERQRLESQLLQAQKMEAVGKMAGGIAHDLNNMLTTVLGTADLLLGRTRDARLTEGLSWIRDAAERSSTLSRSLLLLSREKMTEPRTVDLDAEARELAPVLSGMVRADVELVMRHGASQLWIVIDPAQLKQMLLNLVVNGNEAMTSGGELVVETDRVEAPGDGAEAGEHVALLRVTDTGDGIESEVLAHVFEPFFSTKEHGSGLGLAIVYGIAHRAGGSLKVQSEVGKGSVFEVRLPLVVPPATVMEAPVAAEAPPARGTGTILVAEDDASVRSLVCQALASAGYDVVEAPDGNDALQAFEAAPRSFDLLLTDVVMPGMGGAELAERVKRARPDVPVVFMSGHFDDGDASAYITDPTRDAIFLQKPWKVTQLLAVVARALGAAT